jgi:hypothetical protein
LGITFLTLLLTFSTFFRVIPGLFFTFVILNGVIQAGLGAYLTASLVAVASLFGPVAVQAMVAGQAAVAVAVSGVQVVSAALFLSSGTPESITINAATGSAEERAAFSFFALSTVFLVIGALANQWLVSMPVYKTLVGPLEAKKSTGSMDEIQGLRSSGRSDSSEDKARVLRLARCNIVYEIAVAYAFMITLVSATIAFVELRTDIALVYIPANHHANTTNEPEIPPTPIQRSTFPNFQHRRSFRPIPLLNSKSDHMVSRMASSSLSCTDALYTRFPGL